MQKFTLCTVCNVQAFPPRHVCGEFWKSGSPVVKNPWGLRPQGFWPWDLPRKSIQHDTPKAFHTLSQCLECVECVPKSDIG